MFEGCLYTKEEIEKMNMRDKAFRKERSEKISNAFHAMVMQVVSLVMSILMLIGMVVMGFSYKTPDEKQLFYYFGMGLFFFVFLTIYMGKVRFKNQVEW